MYDVISSLDHKALPAILSLECLLYASKKSLQLAILDSIFACDAPNHLLISKYYAQVLVHVASTPGIPNLELISPLC